MTSTSAPAKRSALYRFWDSDFGYQFRRSPIAMLATLIVFVLFIGAAFAPWLAPHNTLDLATLDLGDARLRPPGSRGAKPVTFLAPTNKAGTCSRRSCSAPAFHL